MLPVGFKLLPPREPTIGRSLFHAARDLFDAGYSSVCLVNADSPTLPTEFLVETVLRLRESGDRVVLGPAADGGYYLIGLKQFHRRLFEEIDWSTERVFRQTLARAEEIGVTVAPLPEWYDVDDEATLAMLAREIGPCRSAASPYRNGYGRPAPRLFSKSWRPGMAGSNACSAVPAPSIPSPAAAGRLGGGANGAVEAAAACRPAARGRGRRAGRPIRP